MSLFGFYERRTSLENPTTPLTSTALLELLGGQPLDSGVTLTTTGALSMSAVYRATSLISSVGGALPLHAYLPGTKDRAAAPLLDNPHPDLTRYELWKLTYVHRCLVGDAFLQKVRDKVGRVQQLWPITPSRCRVVRVRPTADLPSGKLFEVTDNWGNQQVFSSREILHLPGLMYDGVQGLSLVKVAAQGIGMSLAAEKYSAKLFGSGNLLSGILKTDQRLQAPDADRLQARWRTMMSGLSRAHDVAVLDSGASFQSLTMPNDDAQLLDSRSFQITDVCRFWGVPPFLMMQTEKSSSWGTALEQQAVSWVTFDLHTQWLAPTEQRITRELLSDSRYASYVIEGLLRGDSKARAEFYRVMREVGAFSANDIRELENRPPVEGGDTRLQPMNFVPLGTDPVSDGGGPGNGSDAGSTTN